MWVFKIVGEKKLRSHWFMLTNSTAFRIVHRNKHRLQCTYVIRTRTCGYRANCFGVTDNSLVRVQRNELFVYAVVCLLAQDDINERRADVRATNTGVQKHKRLEFFVFYPYIEVGYSVDERDLPTLL